MTRDEIQERLKQVRMNVSIGIRDCKEAFREHRSAVRQLERDRREKRELLKMLAALDE